MIRIYNKDGVVLNTKDKYCTENIEIAIDDTNLRPEYIVKDQTILGVTGKAEAGGIIPSGRIDITENTGSGFLDITEYSVAKVNVPIPEGYIIPTGTLNISKNGTHDVTEYSKVSVGVSPTGQIKITDNGIYNVGQYLTANVQVEGAGGITPEGTIELKTNGDHDVTNYATAKVNVPIPEGYIKPSGTKEITENGTHTITQYNEVNVNVPIPSGYLKPEGTIQIDHDGTFAIDRYKYAEVSFPGYIKPSGNFAITENGDYNIRDKETVSVNVAGGGGGDSLWADYMSAKGTDWSYLFAYSTLENVDKYVADYDDGSVKYLSSTFRNSKIKSAPSLNTSAVIKMDNVFYTCSDLTSFSGWDTSKSTNFASMFYSCYSLENISLDTSSATELGSLCYGCYKLKSLSQLNTDKVTSMSTAFRTCYVLEKIDLTSMDKITSSYSTSNLCDDCYSLRKFIIRNMTKVPTINSNAFTDCHHILGTFNPTYNIRAKQDGFIYVPDDYVEQVKVGTNWSALADYIKPLSELSEEEEVQTEADITKFTNWGSSSALSGITYSDRTYATDSSGKSMIIYFNVPEEATNRKMKINFNLTSTSTAGFYLHWSHIDLDVSGPSYLKTDNCQYYSTAYVPTGEIIYENLPTGEHFVKVYYAPSSSGRNLYFTIEFVE